MNSSSNTDWQTMAARHLPIAMLTLNAQGHIVRGSYRYWQRIGFQEIGSLEGMLISEALPGSGVDDPWTFLERAWQSSEAAAEGLSAGGRTIDAFAQTVEAQENGPTNVRHCQVLIWDRTESVQQLQRQAADCERFQEFTADLPAMLYQIEGNESADEMAIPYVSAAVQTLLGIAPDEIRDNPLLLYQAIHPDDRPAYYERAVEATEKRTLFQCDLRLVARDGAAHWVRLASAPRTLAGGGIHFNGVAIAIGDLMEQIESLRRNCEGMGQFTHDRWQTLIGTKRALEQEIGRRRQMHADLLKEQRTLTKMLELQDQQRRLLSFDMHDGFIQEVVGAKMVLEGLLAMNQPNMADLELATASLTRAIEEARRMIQELRPLTDESDGLLDALDTLSAHYLASGIHVIVEHNLQYANLPQRVQSHAMRMIQESLSNVRRHAQTDSAWVRVNAIAEQVTIEVEDRGVGFDPAAVSGLHFGLEGIRQRARMLGGSARITSHPGEGTLVAIELPV